MHPETVAPCDFESGLISCTLFWDTHSTADYEGEFTPVRVRFAKRLSTGVTIRLDPETLQKLRTAAHEQGIGPTTLIRMWVLERFKQQEAPARK